MPYTKQALDVLGGGRVHCCRDGRQLIDNCLSLPNMYGLLFGQLDPNASREHMTLRMVAARRTLNLPAAQQRGESVEHCFRRITSWADRKKGIHLGTWCAVSDRQRGEALLRLWRGIQDEASGACAGRLLPFG